MAKAPKNTKPVLPTSDERAAALKAGIDVVAIAKCVRQDIAAAIDAGELPALRTSVTTSRYSMGREVNVRVLGFVDVEPGHTDVLNVRRVIAEYDHPHAGSYEGAILSEQGAAVIAKLEAIVDRYYRSTPDTRHANFYPDVKFDVDVTEAERANLIATLQRDPSAFAHLDPMADEALLRPEDDDAPDPRRQWSDTRDELMPIPSTADAPAFKTEHEAEEAGDRAGRKPYRIIIRWSESSMLQDGATFDSFALIDGTLAQVLADLDRDGRACCKVAFAIESDLGTYEGRIDVSTRQRNAKLHAHVAAFQHAAREWSATRAGVFKLSDAQLLTSIAWESFALAAYSQPMINAFARVVGSPKIEELCQKVADKRRAERAAGNVVQLRPNQEPVIDTAAKASARAMAAAIKAAHERRVFDAGFHLGQAETLALQAKTSDSILGVYSKTAAKLRADCEVISNGGNPQLSLFDMLAARGGDL